MVKIDLLHSGMSFREYNTVIEGRNLPRDIPEWVEYGEIVVGDYGPWVRIGPQEIARCFGHRFALDVETTGLKAHTSHIIGVGVHCPDAGVSGYMPTRTPQDREEAYNVLSRITPGSEVIAHNLKFEWHMCNIDPYLTRAKWIDTTILVHLIHSDAKKSLDSVEPKWLGTDSKKKYVQQAPRRGKGSRPIWEWPLDLVAPYCINDCTVEYDLYPLLAAEVAELGLWKLFQKDMRFLRILWKAEHRGVTVDKAFLTRAYNRMEADQGRLERTLHDAVGYTFNWRSPKQLSKALYDDMGYERPKNPYADADGVDRSKHASKGLYHGPMTSTFLLTEKVKHPMGPIVASLREAQKLKATVKKWIDGADEYSSVHTSFNITGTRTSRLSSSSPNLQNIASEVRTKETQSEYSGDAFERTEEYNLRLGFRARPGNKFVAVDWSQMEIRMFGILSQDPNMLPILEAGGDVHGDIAEMVWGTRDKVHREWSKTISFGLLYGMTTGSLMHRLGMSALEAKKVTNDYWTAFPTIQPWLQERIDECRAFGYVRYWSGRIWRQDDPALFYRGANAAIQGGCAEILSIAAIRVDDMLIKEFGDIPYIWNFVHDELIVETPEEHAVDIADRMVEIMQMEDLFDIPWKVSAKIGDTYGSLEEITGAEF